MLVDRILAIEGEPRSLTSGRVVTEHDIQPGAWYLDARPHPDLHRRRGGPGRPVPLRLSGHRLPDARPGRLPPARRGRHVPPRPARRRARCIRYDIHIDRFFRQGDTHLFRFRFEGTVDGEPLLTMTRRLSPASSPPRSWRPARASSRPSWTAGRARRPARRLRPSWCRCGVESYDERQIDALRAGDLAGCFGPAFAGLDLRDPMRLPGGRMKLVDRVVQLDPTGGRFGLGLIRAEADIHPDDWFLTCHFVDDQVMPGTLMYECCLHTLRIFLMRMGWVGERDEVVCEPVPGRRQPAEVPRPGDRRRRAP